jgi:hypothetical protein
MSVTLWLVRKLLFCMEYGLQLILLYISFQNAQLVVIKNIYLNLVYKEHNTVNLEVRQI